MSADSLLRKLGLSVVFSTGLFVAVVALGMLFTALYSTPEDVFLVYSDVGQATQDLAVEDEAKRLPSAIASGVNSFIGAEDKTTVRPMSGVETISLGCLSAGIRKFAVKSSEKHVRVQGRLCQKHGVVDLLGSKMVNQATGLEATLFSLDNGQLSTDYMMLAQGENKMVFEVLDAKGQRITTDLIISFQD